MLLDLNVYTVNVGLASTISVKVKHISGSSGSYEAKLKGNDQLVDTRKVTLGPGESTTVNFTFTPGSEGSYIIDVNGLTGSLRASKEELPLANNHFGCDGDNQLLVTWRRIHPIKDGG